MDSPFYEGVMTGHIPEMEELSRGLLVSK